MIKGMFFTAVGFGAGIAVVVYASRKLEATQRRLSPEGLAAAAGSQAASWRDVATAALAEGRDAATAKEAELRRIYDVGPSPAESGPATDGDQTAAS
jgi:hypothetical protein